MTPEERIKLIVILCHQQHPYDCDPDVADENGISEGDDNGCYVRAWVWVDFSGTDLDKEPSDSGSNSL